MNNHMRKLSRSLFNKFLVTCIAALLITSISSVHATSHDYILLTPSLRRESLNRQLIEHIGATLRHKGISYRIINLADYQQPSYNPDLVNKKTESIQKLWQEINNAKALIIASPEYNRSIPGSFKNILDWLSISSPSCFNKKPVWLLTTSPGATGLIELDKVISYLGAYVYPKEFCLINGHNKNPKKTALNIDFKQQQHLQKSLQDFIVYTDKLIR